MAHQQKVSYAIQASLHDIKLLQRLVRAKDENDANAILTRYKKSLALKGTEIHEFWISLTTGQLVMDARGLVDFCHDLTAKRKPWRGTAPQNEWNP